MIVHEVPPFLTRIGGHWEESHDGKALLVGGYDKWVCPPPEWHLDECPCNRCDAHRRMLSQTVEDINSTQVQEEYGDPELTPEDLERLKGG